MISINLSNHLEKSSVFFQSNFRALLPFFTQDSLPAVLSFLYFLYPSISEYSTMAIAMKKRHTRIHWMIAVELPPDFGELSVTELKIVIVHKNRVNRMPSLPGIAVTGMRKLICGSEMTTLVSLMIAIQSQKRLYRHSTHLSKSAGDLKQKRFQTWYRLWVSVGFIMIFRGMPEPLLTVFGKR